MTVPIRPRTVAFDIGGDLGDCAYRIQLGTTVRRSRYAAFKKALLSTLDLSEDDILPDLMVYADLYGHNEDAMVDGDLAGPPRFVIEEGRHGLFYGTSPDIPGLLATGKTREECETDIGRAIVEMQAAEQENPKC